MQPLDGYWVKKMTDYKNFYETNSDKAVNRIKELENENTRLAAKLIDQQKLEDENKQLTKDLIAARQEIAAAKEFIGAEVDYDCSNDRVEYHENAHQCTAEEVERLIRDLETERTAHEKTKNNYNRMLSSRGFPSNFTPKMDGTCLHGIVVIDDLSSFERHADDTDVWYVRSDNKEELQRLQRECSDLARRNVELEKQATAHNCIAIGLRGQLSGAREALRIVFDQAVNTIVSQEGCGE